MTSPLLGEANVANVLLAVAVARHLGVTDGQLTRAMRRIEIPAHRLQPIVNQAAGVVVIDDSYNSNPTGAASALQILGAFPAQRRMLITPGMVELGPEEERENTELGRRAAAVCDLCLLIGHRGRMIERGLLDAGFPPEQVLWFETGPEAQAALQTHAPRRRDPLRERPARRLRLSRERPPSRRSGMASVAPSDICHARTGSRGAAGADPAAR